MFRHFLWEGLKLRINGEDVRPIDPLYLRQPSEISGGVQFGDSLRYALRPLCSNGDGVPGWVTVTFSELPVAAWHDLPNEEKRRLGVSKGAGVSVVRAGREIDYGWFFLNGKRKENYDDWWRAEIQFSPELDENFGITHTKQQIRPHATLLAELEPDIVETARALNSRARASHSGAKTRVENNSAEQKAATKETLLRSLPQPRPSDEERAIAELLQSRHPTPNDSGSKSRPEYRIIEEDLGNATFFEPVWGSNRLTVVVNPKHRFFKRFYEPLKSGDPEHPDSADLLRLTLLAAARAEAGLSAAERRVVAKFRKEWSQILGVFLKD